MSDHEPDLAVRIAERYWGGDALGSNTIVDSYAAEIRQMLRDSSELTKAKKCITEAMWGEPNDYVHTLANKRLHAALTALDQLTGGNP